MLCHVNAIDVHLMCIKFDSPWAAFTQQCFFMNTVTSVFVFTEEMQRLHIVVLSAEVNYARGMWASTQSSAQCAVENVTSW